MRMHYTILQSNELVTVKVHDQRCKTHIDFVFKRNKDKSYDADFKINLSAECLINSEVAKLVRELSDVSKSFTTPVSIVRACANTTGRQAVHDPIQDRYRLIGLAKDGENMYTVVELGLSISAADEETAKNKAIRHATKLMISTPEKAVEIAKWFELGCPIKETVSGKVPEGVDINDFLAPGEESPLKAEKKGVAVRRAKK